MPVENMAIKRKRNDSGHTSAQSAREAVVRGILQREIAGQSLRASAVEREQPALLAEALKHFRSWGRALEATGHDAEIVSRRRVWTTERVIKTILELAANKVPLNYKSVNDRDAGLMQAALKLFGKWNNALFAAGFDPEQIRRTRRPYTKSEIISMIQQQAAAGKPLVAYRTVPPGAVPAVRRLFGSFAAAIRIAGVIQTQKRPRWSKRAIIEAIQERARNGQPIHCTSVIATHSKLYDAARNHFGSWSQALRAARYNPLEVRRRRLPWDAEAVIAELRRRARLNQPAQEISLLSPVSLRRACIAFFGSLEEAAAAARVDPAKIAYRRHAGRKRRRYRGGGQVNAPSHG